MIHDFILHYRAWAFSRPNADLDRTFDVIQAKLKSISEREEGLGQFSSQTSPRELTIFQRILVEVFGTLCMSSKPSSLSFHSTSHCLDSRKCYIRLFQLLKWKQRRMPRTCLNRTPQASMGDRRDR